MFFEFKSLLCDRGVLADILAPGLVLNFDLVLLENAQKPFVVDASLVILPELVNEVLQLFIVDFQFCADEHLVEVLSSDVTSASLVDHLEEL